MYFDPALAAIRNGHAVRRDSWPTGETICLGKPSDGHIAQIVRTGTSDPYVPLLPDIQAADWSAVWETP